MKTVGYLILLIILFVVLSGCSDEGISNVSESSNTHTESISWSESCLDVSNEFVAGKYLGKARKDIILPAENLFMESSDAFGFNNISIYDTSGTMTMALKEGEIYSCTFGSTVFRDKTELNVKLNELNSKIADGLECELKEFSFVSNEKDIDEYEAVFSCKGILKVEYETELYKLTLEAIGTNGEAIITITQVLK